MRLNKLHKMPPHKMWGGMKNELPYKRLRGRLGATKLVRTLNSNVQSLHGTNEKIGSQIRSNISTMPIVIPTAVHGWSVFVFAYPVTSK